jgi:hypothetical protein
VRALSLRIYLAYTHRVSQKTRVQKREKRRLLEAPAERWKRWDELAKVEGISWAEFARRALLQRSSSIQELVDWASAPERSQMERESTLERLPGLVLPALQIRVRRLSEKPAPKNGAAGAKKKRPAVRRGKGSSRS